MTPSKLRHGIYMTPHTIEGKEAKWQIYISYARSLKRSLSLGAKKKERKGKGGRASQ